MPPETPARAGARRRPFGRLGRWASSTLGPSQKLRWTLEGGAYVLAWAILILAGVYQQVNLILLVAGVAAGPVVASFLVSAAMLKGLRPSRRGPAYVFSGEPLRIDYSLQNDRRWTASLALNLRDELTPVDRTVVGASTHQSRVFFPRVGGQGRAKVRWSGPSPQRGRYRHKTLEMVTRSPFGLIERRVSIPAESDLIVYPTVGQMTRRWHVLQRESAETRRGQRHDRSMQQHEYHGLRDYRPGDSPRWIHWRTTARLGKPMVKEFEQQHDQDLAILLDPWLPRTKVTPERREAVEDCIRFAATLCYETCRQSGRRILLGWTGGAPELVHGPASIKLLHEFLEHLATMRPSTEGGLAALLDALPAATLRESIVIVVSTRPVNLGEEAERSARLSGGSARGLFGRLTVLDASRGDLDGLVQFGDASAAHGPRSGPAIPSRRSDPSFAETSAEPLNPASTERRAAR